MKALVDNSNYLIKVIALDITAINDHEFTVINDVRDSVPEYGLTYKDTQSFSIIDIGSFLPADYASDKYMFASGSILVNPNYAPPIHY